MHHPCIRCRHFPNSSACESLRGDALSGHRHASPPIYSLAHPTALALLLRHSTTDPDLVLSFWKPRNRSLVPRNGTERLGTHPSQHLVAASCQSGSPWPPPSMSQCPSVPKTQCPTALFRTLSWSWSRSPNGPYACIHGASSVRHVSFPLILPKELPYPHVATVPDVWVECLCLTWPSAKNPVQLYPISATPFLAHAT